MEATNVEIFVILLSVLAFGSALIHYTAYAKSRAKVTVKSDLKKHM